MQVAQVNSCKISYLSMKVLLKSAKQCQGSPGKNRLTVKKIMCFFFMEVLYKFKYLFRENILI